ncbi:protein amalgam-like isoform X1 [Watersipora subatra]|uniref:protein amalgam-like isoform X1 n=1 Tax=Watersipora subatra TaxID=2589382 RepID=UPI00355BB3C7
MGLSWQLFVSFSVMAAFWNCFVTGLDPWPIVKGSRRTIKAEAGDSVMLECEVENVPRKLKVKWERCKRFNSVGRCTTYSGMSSRDKVKYARDYGMRQEGAEMYTLYIYDIQPNQAGTYFCSIRTRIYARTEDYIHVVVYQKPVIDNMETTSDLVAREGDSVTLDCLASGTPEPLVMWQRAGARVIPDIGYHKLNKSLTIASCDQDAKGLYICTASNAYGKAIRTISVDCLGRPSVRPTTSHIYQMVGYQIKLTCTIESSPLATNFWWTRNGEMITPENGRYITGNMHAALGRVITKLVLVKGVATSDYTAIYSCHAENFYGVASSNITIEESNTPQSMEGRLLQASSAFHTSFFSFLYIFTLCQLVS